MPSSGSACSFWGLISFFNTSDSGPDPRRPAPGCLTTGGAAPQAPPPPQPLRGVPRRSGARPPAAAPAVTAAGCVGYPGEGLAVRFPCADGFVRLGSVRATPAAAGGLDGFEVDTYMGWQQDSGYFIQQHGGVQLVSTASDGDYVAVPGGCRLLEWLQPRASRADLQRSQILHLLSRPFPSCPAYP